jgi:hypothetical protein
MALLTRWRRRQESFPAEAEFAVWLNLDELHINDIAHFEHL